MCSFPFERCGSPGAGIITLEIVTRPFPLRRERPCDKDKLVHGDDDSLSKVSRRDFLLLLIGNREIQCSNVYFLYGIGISRRPRMC